jgi:aromatic ring hydroxylase
MTGEEYIASIRDGREIYLYGERIKDVTTWEEPELGCCAPGLQGA